MDRSDLPRDTVVTQPSITPMRRISWGAIIAGTVIAVAVGILLALLGLAIGLGAINPAQEQDPLSGIGIGAMIWWVISSLIALFIGSWVAGRLSTVRARGDGMLNGLVVWGLSTVVTVYLLTSAVGMLMGGAFSILSTGLATAGQAASAVAPEQGQLSWDQIANEARQLLSQAGKTGQQNGEQAQQPGGDLSGVLSKLLREGGDSINEADKEAVVKELQARTNMSRQEASQTVDRWIQSYQGATEQATETAQATTDVASRAAWASFFMLLLGAGAAALGGFLGTSPPSGDQRTSATYDEEHRRAA
jgi:hypothetical protein